MRIGILSAGGDCPGINAAIRGACKTAINCYGMEVVGIKGGFEGLINRDIDILTDDSMSGLLSMGGTILGTSRFKQYKKNPVTGANSADELARSINELGLDAVVCIGGNGTQKTAYKMAKHGLNVIGVPKTIDNDIWGTEETFGFDTAVSIATDAIDRLHSTASSHNRAMVIEVMGHKAGWLALHSGMASGGDVILLPEIPYDLNNVYKAIAARAERGKKYSIIVVGEGVPVPEGATAGTYITRMIEQNTGVESRLTVLGYTQRGGSPTAYDRNLSTRIGAKAAELISKGEFGRMVCIKDGKTDSQPLSEVAGRLKLVMPDNELLIRGRQMGLCFG